MVAEKSFLLSSSILSVVKPIIPTQLNMFYPSKDRPLTLTDKKEFKVTTFVNEQISTPPHLL